MALDDIRIVLVEPAHPGNIGAVARAMNTMAVSRLILVRPVEFPSEVADRRAMGSLSILQQAEVAATLDEAVADCRLVIGCSARPRSFPHTILDPRQCAARLVDETSGGDSAALVFGPERTGLANQELDRCNYQVRIPTNEEFGSLNLAAAVQLICYELFLAHRGASSPTPRKKLNPADRPSDHEEMEHFFDHLERALDSRGYLDGEMREVTLMKMRRLFGRARPNLGEVKLLHSLMRLIHKDGG